MNDPFSEFREKLRIAAWNDMQLKMFDAVAEANEVQLIAPTGSGKTLAYLLPLIGMMDAGLEEVQCLVLVPSRELAVQVESVVRSLGSGLKCNAVYGGQARSQDKLNLRQPPHVLIATPGRLADHVRRESFRMDCVRYLVLDEFDKSLEVGFELDMAFIVQALESRRKTILTSATEMERLPDFLGVSKPVVLRHQAVHASVLEVRGAQYERGHAGEALVKVLESLVGRTGIVFCNFRESIAGISQVLDKARIPHATFFGTMEQRERELSLIKFRNGSAPVLVATDLAARGLDIPGLDFIVHYELPGKEEEFVHRNGRTARMNADGLAIVMHEKGRSLPPFMGHLKPIDMKIAMDAPGVAWSTLRISAGRRDKISKGDVAGFLMKVAGLGKDEVGLIEVQMENTYVAVPSVKMREVLQKGDQQRLKQVKPRLFPM